MTDKHLKTMVNNLDKEIVLLRSMLAIANTEIDRLRDYEKSCAECCGIAGKDYEPRCPKCAPPAQAPERP